MYNQSTNRLVMVEPMGFASNIETWSDNSFQSQFIENEDNLVIKALEEFYAVVQMLKDNECEVFVLKPMNPDKTPDAVFPNNWFSLGPNGILMIYPMKAESRALEVQPNIAGILKNWNVNIHSQLDWSPYRLKNKYLEGTGSLVLDHVNKIAFLGVSERSHIDLAIEWGEIHQYELVTFETSHQNLDRPIYHTNVMLSILTQAVVVCSEVITPQDRDRVIHKLAKSRRTLVDISFDQMCNFCGNILEVNTAKGEIAIAMSSGAYDSFTEKDKAKLESNARIIHVPIPTIETLGGGGMRCMLAEVFN